MRAEKEGYLQEQVAEDLDEILLDLLISLCGRCAYSMIKFNFDRSETEKGCMPSWYPSVERLDTRTGGGYIRGNVTLVCGEFNVELCRADDNYEEHTNWSRVTFLDFCARGFFQN